MPYKDPERKREYQNNWYKQRRLAWIASQGGKCVKCGSTERLQVDHRNPLFKWSHKIWSYRKAIRERELKKCQVLCEDCHKEKTAHEKATAFKRSPSRWTPYGKQWGLPKTAQATA